MTHLRIEQNTGIRETVASGVIKKLYDLAKEIELDANGTVALKGWLYTSATYLDYITYLENISKVNDVPLLTIEAGKEYIRFEDPNVLSILTTECGDGVGVTMLDLLNITTIGELFKGNTTITKFNEFLNFTSVSATGAYAFAGCSSLQSINISNLSIVGSHCFDSCSSLTSVTIDPNKLITIGSDAFVGCTNWIINDLSLPNLTSLGPTAFERTGLKKISNLGLITSIPNICFSDCTLLTSVTLSSSITSIGDYSFRRCTALPSIDLSNVTSIGSFAFQECSSLTSIDLSNVTSIGNYAFLSCTNLVNVGTLNSSLTTIPNGCFQSCSSLTNIDLSHITNLGENAFRDCTSLGTGQTLELNLTNLTRHFGGALYNTKFSRVILHRSNTVMGGDRNNPPLEYLPNATYIDVSDFPLFMSDGHTLVSVYEDNSLVTLICPSNLNWLTGGQFKTNPGTFRYMIILATTPPNIETTDHNNPPSDWFYNTNLHIYVPDSAKATYLADTDWASIGGYNGSDTITDRLHGLSELPNGVWTTGLASQYLTPALLATS